MIQASSSHRLGRGAFPRLTLSFLVSRLAFRQLIRDLIRAENFAQDFEDAARIHRDGAIHRLVVDEVADERLYVAVEDQPDKLSILVDGRRAAVAANDVIGRDEVEGRLEIERV